MREWDLELERRTNLVDEELVSLVTDMKNLGAKPPILRPPTKPGERGP